MYLNGCIESSNLTCSIFQTSSVADDEHMENTPDDNESELPTELYDTLTEAVGVEEATRLATFELQEFTDAVTPSCDEVALVPSMENGQTCMPVKALCRHEQMQKSKAEDKSVQYPPIRGSTEELCVSSIKHIIQVKYSIVWVG